MTAIRHKTSTACVLFAVMLLCVTPASGATFHVSPFGSNTPPYDTYAKAAHRMIDAVRRATGQGDTVLVHAGTYDVDSTLFFARGVTWLGTSRDSTVVVWMSRKLGFTALAELFGQNEVAGIDFEYPFGSSNLESYALWPHPYPEADTVEVRDCRFHLFRLALGGNTRAWVFQNEFYHRQSVGVEASSQFADIRHNLFSGGSPHFGGSIGIKVDGGSAIIEENVFDNTITESGETSLARPDEEIYVNGASQISIRNNLIRQTERPFRWYYANGIIENNTIIDAIDRFTSPPFSDANFFQRADQTLSIRNNLFLDNSARLEFGLECTGCDSTGWIVLSHNAYWPPVDSFYRTWPDDPPSSIKIFPYENFNAFPMLTDDSLFRLQAGSPLIDAGDPSILDVDGSRSDIGWTGGPLGYSYPYVNLPPLPPDSLWVTGASGLVSLVWSSRHEADLADYRLYRGSASGFWTPGMTPHRVLNPADTAATDTLLSAGDSYYYVLTARDTAGMESEPSPERSFIVSGILDDPVDSPIPRTPYIARLYPNPFNAATTIEVFIPDVGVMPAPARITLYDVMGRLVSVPFDGSLNPGNHAIPLSATDSQGRALASGVYFARLRVWSREFGGVKKLVVLK